MPKRTSPADATPLRVVIVTMDSHLSGAAARARNLLRRDYPGLELTVHSADEWGTDRRRARRAVMADIATGDIVIATMLFLDDHVRAVMPALQARRKECDAMVCCMSAAEVVKLTRVGKFDMSAEALGMINWLKKLRGKKTEGSAGKGEMKMLRQLPKLLRFIPGTAQDMRAYFLTLQYWLAGSEQNIANMVRLLVDRYADGPRKALRGIAKVEPPIEYADIGVYHPKMKGRIAESVDKLPAGPANAQGHRRRAAAALLSARRQCRSLRRHDRGVRGQGPARRSRCSPRGLDQRPAIEHFFMKNGRSDRRRGGLAHRLLAGRRPRLQRLEGRRGHPGRRSTCRICRRIRSNSRRSSNGPRRIAA